MAATRQGLPSLVDDAQAAPRPGAAKSQSKPEGSGNRRQLLLGAGAIVVLLVSAGFAISSLRGGNEAAEASRRRVVIDAQTGEVIQNFPIKDGTAYPLRNPTTGTDTLYPAEACFWNADGTAKITPTYVFVRSYLGEPGETKCPECGRRVVPHNPMPPDQLMLDALERSKQTGGN